MQRRKLKTCYDLEIKAFVALLFIIMNMSELLKMILFTGYRKIQYRSISWISLDETRELVCDFFIKLLSIL